MNKSGTLFFVRRTVGRRPFQSAKILKWYKPVAIPVVAAYLVFVTVGGCAPSKSTAEQPDGKALYTTYCVSCHGAGGRNDRNGAVPAMRLAAANTLTADDWNRLVLNGRGQMPAFHDRLTEVQLRALNVYIRQLTARP